MPDPKLFHAIAGAMLDRRIRNMRRLNEKTWIDTSLITHAEYQLFLDEMYAQGNYYQPDQWKDRHFPFGEAQVPIVGLRFSDAKAFCIWLGEQGWGKFRLPYEHETIGIDEMWPGYWQLTSLEEGEYKGKNLALDIELERVYTCVSHLIHDLNLGGEIERNRIQNYSNNLDLDLTSDLVEALEFGCSTSLDYDINSNEDLPGALTRNRDLTRNVAYARTLQSVLNLVLLRNYECINDKLEYSINEAIAYAPKIARDHYMLGDYNLALALALARITHYSGLDHFPTTTTEYSPNFHLPTDCDFPIVFSLALASLIADDDYGEEGLKIIISNLIILLLRREGLLPAFEGILIVREEED